MRIELAYNYFIDTSENGYVLKKQCHDNNVQEIGFSDELAEIISKFLKIAQIDDTSGLHTYFAHYSEKIEKSNAKTIEAIKDLIS